MNTQPDARREKALAEALAALEAERGGVREDRKKLDAESRATAKERGDVATAWRKIKEETAGIEKREKSIKRLVDSESAEERRALAETQEKLRASHAEVERKTARLRAEGQELQRLRHAADSLAEGLRKKSKELAAREAELESRRAEVERLRRRLEGVL